MNKTVTQKIALSQMNSLCLEKGSEENNKQVKALVAEAAFLGFKFERKLLNVLKTLSKKDLKKVRDVLFDEMKDKVGFHSSEPLFRNFPEDIPNEEVYFLKRIVGFLDNFLEVSKDSKDAQELSCGHYVHKDLFDVQLFGACPICQRQTNLELKPIKRKKLRQKVGLKEIKLISGEEFVQKIEKILANPTSYSKAVREDLPLIVALMGPVLDNVAPKEFKNKENLALLYSLAFKKGYKIQREFKTTTDVLRLAVALSEGDISLKYKSNFNLKNQERKEVVRLLNQVKSESALEDMLRYRQKWLRLGEYLHISEKRTKANSYVLNNFKTLREREETIETFNKKVHNSCLKVDSNLEELLSILTKRPGEFARRLDLILRKTKNPQIVLDKFEGVIEKLSNVMIIKLSSFFKTRNEKREIRFFIPKGDTTKVFVKDEDKREVLQDEIIQKVSSILENEILKRFKKQDYGKVYIDPALKGILTPLTLKTSTKSLMTLERGSKVAFNPKAKVIRMFTYWKENDNSGRVDVDLSAAGFDQNWNFKTHLSWTSLEGLESQHSGDIQSAPEGASEYIDINLKSFRDHGIRYVVMSNISFTGQSFDQFEAFSGIMERENIDTGEVFEPKTVKQKFDLSGESTSNLSMILDLVSFEIIWANISLGSKAHRVIQLSQGQTSRTGKALLEAANYTPSLYDLFALHVKANGGELVDKKSEDCSHCFDMSQAKDVNTILSDWI